MPFKTALFLLLLFALVHPRTGSAQTYKSYLDSFLNELSETSTGGAVLVAKNGDILYRESFGKANLELDLEMAPDHVFRIGSITKQFTAAAILRLQEEGKLSVEDDIKKYIEDYPANGRTITIEHLLTHTSGIANYSRLRKFDQRARRNDMGPKELIDFFKNEPMDFDPGDGFKYNNSGYVLLGYIIELVTGSTYAEYIQENFFSPLGMRNSYYDISTQLIENRAPGYGKGKAGHRNASFLSMTLPYAGGSLLSTVDDLYIWNKAVADYKVLDKESTTKAHSRYILNTGRPTDYGYGWRLGNIQGTPSLKHGGSVNGFTSYALYLPKTDVYVVVLTNCDCTGNIEIIASKMAATVIDTPYKFKDMKMSTKGQKVFQGVYRSKPGEELTIRHEDGRLVYFRKGGSKATIFPFEKHKFHQKAGLTTFEFTVDRKGRSQGFVMKGLDSPIEWHKTDDKVRSFKSIPMTPKEMETYLGEYRLSNGRIFKIVAEGTKLFGQMGENREEIVPLDPKVFFAKDIDAQLIFDLEKAGTVSGLTIVQSDHKKAVKIE